MVAVAQIGCGYWGKNLVRNFHELGALAAVVDTNAALAASTAAQTGVPALSVDDALASPAIDAVSIASPAVLHYETCRRAVEAGKHVFVEKPLALDVGEAEALATLARERGRVLMVGHLLQYHPVYRKLREIVAAGELGAIRYAYSNRLSLGKFRIEENVLWSFAPHDISMLLGLFGEEPASVTAQGTASYTRGVEDVVTVQMKFASGAGAHVLASWMHPVKEQRLVVIGETAMAVFEDSEAAWDKKLQVFDHRIERQNGVPVPAKAEPRLVIAEKGEPLKLECQHFVDCIASGSTPVTGPDEAIGVLRVLARAQAALDAAK